MNERVAVKGRPWILMKIIEFAVTMAYFETKMHQIRFGLGLFPDLAGGAYTYSVPQTP